MQKSLIKQSVIIVTTVFLVLVCSIWFMGRIGIESYRILSGSMEPFLRFGDIVLVNTNERKAENGEIIAFWTGETITVHRVMDKKDDDQYITKGDANTYADFQPVEQEAVIDCVCGRVRYIAWFWMLFTTKIRYVVLIVIVLLNVIADRIYEEDGGILVGDG